mgnify:CR=1 FL=1
MRAFIVVVILLCVSYYVYGTEIENNTSLPHADRDIQNPADTPSADMLDMSIEDLMEIEVSTVYAASRHRQKVTEAPSSVSIVTSDDIKKYGYRTLADILNSVRGFYVTYDRNYSYLGSRGFSRPGDYNSRYLVMVDGLRLNDAVYDTASIGTEFVLDVDLIDRVEVIHGPGSSLYGSNAFFGVINVITKRGRDFSGAEVSGEGASHDTYKSRVSYGNSFKNGLEMLVSASYYDSNGRSPLYYKEFDHPVSNYGITENSDSDQYESVFGGLSYRDFVLQGAFASREKEIPTASFGTVFGDSHNDTLDEQGYISLLYEHNFEDLFEVQSRIYYNSYYYHGNYEYDYSEGSGSYTTINQDYADGKWWGGDLMFKKTLFEKHLISFGSEYRNYLKQYQKNYDVEVRLDDEREASVWGFYLQDEFTILKNLRLNAGLRYDHYETFEGAVSPRAALIYNPLERTTLKFIYGEAFRAPNAYEMYYEDGGYSHKGNHGLDEERIKSYELVMEQYFKNGLYLTATGFLYEIDDLISLESDSTDGLSFFDNTDEVETRGAGLEIGRKWDSGINGKIGYSFQYTEDKSDKTLLTNSPKHLTKLNCDVPLIRKKLFIGLEEQYTSKRKTLDGDYADDFFITNLTLFSRNLRKGLELSGSVYNLLNKKYEDPGSLEHAQDLIEQDGRTFRIKISYRF